MSDLVHRVRGRASIEALVNGLGVGRRFDLDGSRIRSTQDFFALANQCLPLDPPLGAGLRWDALADSLWSGIDALATPRVVIVWTGADEFERQDAAGFREALSCLAEVARLAADPSSGIDTPTELHLVLSTEA